MYHRRYLYAGVIVGWNPCCMQSEEWMRAMGVDKLPGTLTIRPHSDTPSFIWVSELCLGTVMAFWKTRGRGGAGGGGGKVGLSGGRAGGRVNYLQVGYTASSITACPHKAAGTNLGTLSRPAMPSGLHLVQLGNVTTSSITIDNGNINLGAWASLHSDLCEAARSLIH